MFSLYASFKPNSNIHFKMSASEINGNYCAFQKHVLWAEAYPECFVEFSIWLALTTWSGISHTVL